jgi:hypothetical protein
MSLLTDVVIVPRSGYTNRLQAIASAALLARAYGSEFRVCWESQPVAPAPPVAIFDSSFVERTFMSPETFLDSFGIESSRVPPYLTVNPGLISLAGLDRGEQVFMPELVAAIADLDQPTTVMISAGGNYSVESPGIALDQRGQWYRECAFAEPIMLASQSLIETESPYIGVHLRYTDRAHETPLARDVLAAITKQVEITGLTSVFIASDTVQHRNKWVAILTKKGLHPWTAQIATLDRSQQSAGAEAMIDWRILGNAQTSVYFAASSFGQEAAVMAGSTETSIALPGHPFQRLRARASDVMSAAIHYPRNHWFR